MKLAVQDIDEVTHRLAAVIKDNFMQPFQLIETSSQYDKCVANSNIHSCNFY